MKGFLKTLFEGAKQINEWVGRATSWLTLVLVLVVCVDVTRRYLFQSSSVWVGELEWHLYALIFLFGAGYALKHDRHVRVDLFYAKYSPRDRHWTNLLGHLLFLVPWCILIIVTSYSYAQGSFAINEGSPNPNGLPYRFIIKFAITIGVGLLLLQAILQIIDSISYLIQPKDQSK